ncbi:hypothetical protein HDU79_000430 [Rhizoclosmatium sp. JEL0117]|nr:hypothetical protein HDU79_000430 [Rhizoclosmatium sp. JEL0117]
MPLMQQFGRFVVPFALGTLVAIEGHAWILARYQVPSNSPHQTISEQVSEVLQGTVRLLEEAHERYHGVVNVV